MDRELNYQHEAETQQLFKQKVTVTGLSVPTVYAEYSNAKILVQSWESGAYIDDISHWPAVDRKAAAEILLATLFKSLFEVGIVHGDPHKGNSYFRYDAEKKPEVVLMDYGCTIKLSEIQRLSLLKLILASTENRDISPLRYFVAMGFDADKLVNIGDALPMLCRLLFKPFIEPNTFFVSHWMLESNFNKLLEQRRWWFRSAGPAELFLLMRAFQGVVQQFQILKTNVSWSQLLYETLSPDLIDKAHALTLAKLPQENKLLTASALAKSLRVKVSENEQQIVNITLPAEMVLDLENLMPEEVVSQIRKSNSLDLDAIQRKIRESGIAPQSLFNFENGEKLYQIWLE
jgi:predicted unusual protein kinase regulating ubiquinone biosynthesis (AarF/ABC1/UbiB family)